MRKELVTELISCYLVFMPILLFLLWPFMVAALPPDCESALSVRKTADRLQASVAALNPSLMASPAKSVGDLYLRLKTEEHLMRASVNPLHEAFTTHLRAHFSKAFRVEDVGPADLRQMYLNSLRSLYLRVANQWKEQEASELVPEGAEDRAWLHTAGILIDSFINPRLLEKRDTSPAVVELLFIEKPWQQLDWGAIYQLFSLWRAEKKPFSSREFSEFWNVHADQLGLNLQSYFQIMKAVSGFGYSYVCCLSEPGCRDCPHNRHWRR